MHHGSKEERSATVWVANAIIKKTKLMQEDGELENIFLEMEDRDEIDGDEQSEIGAVAAVSEATVVSMGERKRGPCKPNIDRTHQKEFWTNG